MQAVQAPSQIPPRQLLLRRQTLLLRHSYVFLLPNYIQWSISAVLNQSSPVQLCHNFEVILLLHAHGIYTVREQCDVIV